ncbi:MAG: DUF2157 domain-containing protein [Victivallaceae bacterium]|jgi:uncharacterized membrane protein
MSDRKKIEWLLGELPVLKEKGILSGENADALNKYYQSIMPPKANFQQLVIMFFGILSAALIGAGIILIIACNWDDIPRHIRAGMAFIPLLLAAGFGGYTLRRGKGAAWQESAAILTALSSAAAIALISQTYQLGGTLKDFLFVWMLLFFLLIYIFNSAGTFLIYAVALTVWNFNRWDMFSTHVSRSDTYFFALFIALPLWWLIVNFRKAPYGLKSSLFCWVITIFTLLNSIHAMAGYNDLQIKLYWALILAVLFLAGALRRSGGAGFWGNPLLPSGAVGITIYSAIASFSDFWNYHPSYYSSADNIMYKEYYGWVVIGIIGAAWLLLLVKRWNNEVELIPALLPLLVLIPVLIFPAAGGYVFDLYLLLAGIVFMRYGFKKYELFKINAGMFLLSLLLFLRFVDSGLDILLRGCLFILLGVMFLVVNIIASKKFKKAEKERKEAGI